MVTYFFVKMQQIAELKSKQTNGVWYVFWLDLACKPIIYTVVYKCKSSPVLVTLV